MGGGGQEDAPSTSTSDRCGCVVSGYWVLLVVVVKDEVGEEEEKAVVELVSVVALAEESGFADNGLGTTRVETCILWIV